MKKEDILFIINPISGGVKKDFWSSSIDKIIDKDKYVVKLEYTKAAFHATELASKAVQDGYKKIVAIGGDGTINEIATALLNTDVALGIVPKGSGNGLARHLKIPLIAEEALSLINNCREIFIDSGEMNSKPFFCTAGVGFDAHIGHVFANLKGRGFRNYLKAVVKEYFQYKPSDYSIFVDERKIEEKAFFITFANSSQFGNNACISPCADIQDGYLDVCVMNPFSFYNIPHIGYRLFNGSMDRCKYLTILKGKDIVLRRAVGGAVHLDGEPYEMGEELKIKINPSSLKMMVL